MIGIKVKNLLYFLVYLILLFNYVYSQNSAIIADHNAVSNFDDIPSEYLKEVKKMLLNIPGESHSRGYYYGLELLEDSLGSEYAVNVTWGETAPEAYTDTYLRATGVDRSQYQKWAYGLGEKEWYCSATDTAILREYHFEWLDANNPAIIGFGWCWDMTWHNSPGGTIDPVYGVRWAGSSDSGPDGDLRWGIDDGDITLTGNSVTMQWYLNAVDDYNSICDTNTVIFTTGPVDGYAGENGYQRYLKHEAIRDYVIANGGYLLDYADILCWEDGVQYTQTWDGNTHQIGDPQLASGGTGYDGGEGGCHITEKGCIYIAKGIWWLLARMSGWSGSSNNIPHETINIPKEYGLYQNFPNPFNPTTTIQFDIPRPGEVIIDILDIQGRLVKTILNDFKPKGIHQIEFSVDDLASGVYLYKLQVAEKYQNIKKMIILK